MKAILVTDGCAKPNPGYCSVGVLILDNNKIVKKIHRKLTWGTNNIAECSALIEGIHQLKELGYKDISAYTDSELMYNHFNGSYRINNPQLKELHKTIQFLIKDFDVFTLEWHRRNTPLAEAADALANGKMDIENICGINI